jgi:hypothetical protein
MSTRLKIGTVTRSLFAMLFVAQGFAACTTQEATDNGTGGKPAGGNTGGTATGGSTAPTGGSAATDGVMCEKPAQALITDFTYTPSDAGTANTKSVHFGNSTTFQGGHYIYPEDGTWPLVSDVTKNNWHISGAVGTYSGFRLFFDNCTRVDASKYKGISFKISGSVPQGNIVTLGVETLNNSITASWLKSKGVADVAENAPGRCVPISGSNKYDQPTCKDNVKPIPVTATPTEIKVLWEDFIEGKPDIKVIPTDILAIYWFFPPPTDVGKPTVMTYAADLTIDDLSFIP